MRGGRAVRAILAVLLAAAVPLFAQSSSPADGTGANWPNTGGAYDESGFSRLGQIDQDTIARLGLVWSLDLPGEVTLEATPLAVDGVLYFSGSYAAVYAVNAANGALLWRYDPQSWKHAPQRMPLNFSANRGVAYDQGRVFVAAFDGRLIALDARTGKELWVAETLPPGSLMYSTGAPRVFNDKVIIGNGGGDFGSRGLCHRLRSGHWTAGVAVLHRAGQPGRKSRQRCHGTGRQHLDRRMVEDRHRRHGVERHDLRS